MPELLSERQHLQCPRRHVGPTDVWVELARLAGPAPAPLEACPPLAGGVNALNHDDPVETRATAIVIVVVVAPAALLAVSRFAVSKLEAE